MGNFVCFSPFKLIFRNFNVVCDFPHHWCCYWTIKLWNIRLLRIGLRIWETVLECRTIGYRMKASNYRILNVLKTVGCQSLQLYRSNINYAWNEFDQTIYLSLFGALSQRTKIHTYNKLISFIILLHTTFIDIHV